MAVGVQVSLRAPVNKGVLVNFRLLRRFAFRVEKAYGGLIPLPIRLDERDHLALVGSRPDGVALKHGTSLPASRVHDIERAIQ